MKCPNCGAEITGKAKFCGFCGSSITVQMLKEQEQLNKAGCPRCRSTNISFSREKQGELKGRRGTAVIRSTVGVCKDCGYTWQTDSNVSAPKKRRTWLWVLGWIFIFPLPLTILLLRKKQMKPIFKYGIIAVAWIAYFLIGLSGNSKETSVPTDTESGVKTMVAEQNTEDNTTTEQTPDSMVLYFVDSFNNSSEEKLVFSEDFTPSDETNSHYRTEFRLNAYSEAIGKSYLYKKSVVDIVANESIFGEVTYRIYMHANTLDDVIEMVEIASPIMDSSLKAVDLKDTLDYLSENKSANGYYYGELGIELLEDDNNAYDLMIKMD